MRLIWNSLDICIFYLCDRAASKHFGIQLVRSSSLFHLFYFLSWYTRSSNVHDVCNFIFINECLHQISISRKMIHLNFSNLARCSRYKNYLNWNCVVKCHVPWKTFSTSYLALISIDKYQIQLCFIFIWIGKWNKWIAYIRCKQKTFQYYCDLNGMEWLTKVSLIHLSFEVHDPDYWTINSKLLL